MDVPVIYCDVMAARTDPERVIAFRASDAVIGQGELALE